MRKILIVEDEKMIRQGIRVMIENSDVLYEEIHECRHGKEASEYLKENACDLVLTDIKMPFMDGIELTAWMREHLDAEQMPIIVVISGYGEYEYVRMAMKQGAIDYLLKPVDREELKRILWQAEESWQKRRPEPGGGVGSEGRISPVNQRKMQEAVSYLYRNYARPVDMAEVSNHISMNYTMFSAEFKKYTGQKFSAWLNRLRIEKAKKLILDSDLKLNEVGVKVGFEDAARFTKVFREETGMTPSMYREYSMKKRQGN